MNNKEVLKEKTRLAAGMVVEAFKELQQAKCDELGVPNFAPESGECWSCHRQIYNRATIEGLTKAPITGCPYCARSFVD